MIARCRAARTLPPSGWAIASSCMTGTMGPEADSEDRKAEGMEHPRPIATPPAGSEKTGTVTRGAHTRVPDVSVTHPYTI